MKNLIATSIFLFFVGNGLLLAQSENSTKTRKANVRQASQQVRIAEGVKSGELTRTERIELKRQQRHIRRVERRVKADGDVTAREKRKINRKQNRANRNIRRKKNNSEDRN